MATTMRATHGDGGALDLGENEARALPRSQAGGVVRVHRGTVLVTQEGDRDDHVLEAGDEIRLRRRGRAVAWAFTGATISLLPPGAPASRPALRAVAPAREPGGELGSAAVHELKSSLTAVKALVQLGLRDPAEGSSHRRLAIIEEAVARMQEVLDGHLSAGRPLPAAEPSRVDLGRLAAAALRLLSGQASEAGVRLLARGDAAVEGDARRLEEALVNLVANAIEATPPGGEVAVEVRPSAGRVELLVRDTGRGMSPETLRRVGTPFFTTRRNGTGLGVALARSAIVAYGGSLEYASQPGKGTTARAILPAPVRAA